MRDLGKRVGLIEELRQLAGTKEGVDDGRKRAGIDEVHRSKHLVVAHIHSFADGAGHTSQTNAELSIQLLAYAAYAAVAQVVNIVNLSLLVHQAHQIHHDGNNILAGEHQCVHAGFHAELAVDLVSAYFAKVVALVGEEQFFDDTASRFFVWRISTAQLTIDINHCFDLRTGGVFLQCIIDDRVILVNVFFLKDDHIGFCI